MVSSLITRMAARLLPKQFLQTTLDLVSRSHIQPPQRGTRDILEAYSTMPWLRAAVSKVSSSAAATEWKLFREVRNSRSVRSKMPMMGYESRRRYMKQGVEAGTLREVEDHELIDLLETGNDYMTGLDVRRTTQTQIDLVGEAFWLKERDGRGVPVRIWPLSPHWITNIPSPSTRPVFEIRVDGGSKPVEIPFSEIVWFRETDPFNPYGRGTGTARALADELETDEYAAKHTKSWFFNGARPDFIVSADGLLRSETERIERDWESKHRGFWKAFRPHFLNRKVDVQTLSQSFQDMQMTDLRKHERDTIVQVYGIPPELLGILQASNRATIETAGFLFSRWVLVPRLELLRSALQRGLVQDFDERIIIDYVTPVDEDKEFRLKVIDSAPWSFKVDEIRRMANMEPLMDGTGQNHVVPQKFDIVTDLSPRTGGGGTSIDDDGDIT